MTTELRVLAPDQPSRRVAGPVHAVVKINAERCAGCQECIIRCPTGALDLDAGKWIARATDQQCVGCRQCERVCPYAAIQVSGPVVVAPRWDVPALHPEPLAGDTREIRRGFASWHEALSEADRCLLCPDPTCVQGCPAHNDIPGFMAALRARDLQGAHRILRQTSVLPDICARVCDQSVQCEGACSWMLAGGQPVAIGRLERFISDQHPIPGVERVSREGQELSVAVVGSGPAGCAAAWELLAAGARVTMLEKDPTPGGVLRWGIPDFTLPPAVAERPIASLVEAGLTLQTGRALGRDVGLDHLLAEHDGVILAHGAALPLRPPVAGIDLPGVEDAATFLEESKRVLREGTQAAAAGPNTRILVIGGGNTAMDVARSARRLGATVLVVEWMDERFSRVRPDELTEARLEGVEMRFATTVERLEGDSAGVRLAWLRRTRQRRIGDRPKLLRGTPESVAIDRVILALGYRVDSRVAAAVAQLPLPRPDLRHAFPGRRWLASGILTRSGAALGTQALEREIGLAVASSSAPAGWWALFQRRPAVGLFGDRFRSWARLWRRQAAIGLAAAATPYSDRVWVAGDALVGPSTVVGSMAQGREAARALLKAHPQRASQHQGRADVTPGMHGAGRLHRQ